MLVGSQVTVVASTSAASSSSGGSHGSKVGVDLVGDARSANDRGNGGGNGGCREMG